MLNFILRLALNHRLFVLAAAVVTLAFGLQSLQSLPVDVFPDITKPTVTIITEAHGMAPEEVETRVTLQLESYLNGVPGMERIRSQSGIGLSAIQVEFGWNTDIYRNRQLIQEKINLARHVLPKDISPSMGPVGSLLGQIQQIAVSSENSNISPMELRNIAEWVLRPRLMTISGVAQVISIGGGLKQYQILVSAEKLNQRQLSIETIDHELSQISQNTTGGFLEKQGQEYLIRNIGIVNSVADIQNTLVGLHFGKPVLIKDIAEVREAPRLKRGDGSFNGKPSVVMTIQKQPGADTLQITQEIEKAIDSLRPSFPKGLVVNTDVFKQSNFISASIMGLQGKLKWASALVFAILILFLANLRMSLITMTAIPLSFLTSFVIFKFFGLTLNTMTLGGLAIAIGELVDDSIVDVENVYRRLRENSLLKIPKSSLKVIYEASSEVRNSIVLATGIIALVFLPIFNLTGIEGRLFSPLGIAYLTALFSSLVISLTLTPVLCFYFLKGNLSSHRDTRLVILLKKWDRRILEGALPRTSLILGSALLLFAGSLALIPLMGRDFLPKFNEGTAMIALVAPAGTSLTESNRIGLLAEKILLETPEIKSVSRRTGRAELDEHAAGVHVSEMDVDFHSEGRNREVVLNELRGRLKKEIPNIGVNLGQPISHMIDHMLSGVSAAIAIKIFGSDLTVLRQKALEVQKAIQNTPGLVDLRIEQQGLVPQVKIHILRDEAAKFGLSPGEITKLLEGALNGEVVAQVMEGVRIFDVFFQYDQASRESIARMEKMVLKVMPTGQKVLLEQVADIYETTGPNEINRENNHRRMVLSANLSGRDLGSLISEIRSKVDKNISFDEGYYVVYGGQFEAQQAATLKILLFGAFAILAVAVLLTTHFHSKTIALQILATLPLAFTGGILLLFVTDRTITVASLIGFITLCGIASRNSIMMISHYLHLMKFEGHSFTKEMLIKGSQERLVPVLMTASVASLALMPLVFSKGQPGSEILHPVAVVIVGGLVTSTLLDLVMTPLLFFKFGKSAAEKYLKYNENHERISP